MNARTLGEGTDGNFAFRYIDIGAVSSGVIAIPEDDIEFASAPTRARRLAEPADTIVSTVRTYLRAVAPVPTTEMPLVFSTGFTVLHPLAAVEPRFLSYYCQSTPFVDEIVARSVGVSYPAISASEIGSLHLSLPARDEQRRIADFLDEQTRRIDGLILNGQRLTALVTERWDAFLTEVVTGERPGVEMSPTGDPFVPRVASGWRLCRLKDLSSRIDVGIAEAATHAFASEGVPLLRSMNIRPNMLAASEVLYIDPTFDVRNHRKRLRANDILTVRTGNAGVSAVVPELFAGSQTFTQLMTSLLPEFTPEFICFYLNSSSARGYFDATAWGSAQRNISVPILANVPTPCPPPREQALLAKRLRNERACVDALLDAVSRRMNVAREMRQVLVTSAVGGQLDVSTAREVA